MCCTWRNGRYAQLAFPLAVHCLPSDRFCSALSRRSQRPACFSVCTSSKCIPRASVTCGLQEDNALTWEPTANLSEDLVRDFEEAFWQACRIGDMTFLNEALKYGGETLANLINSEGRAPLHLTAALNHQVAVKKLVESGVRCAPHTLVWF